MKNFKKTIPNILTFLRIVITPIAIFLGIKGHYQILAIMCFIIAFTDFLDGKLARKWDVCSDFGAKLDAVADKILAFGLLIVLILKNNIFLYLLLFEILISLFNIFSFIKTNLTESLLVGKIKTWILFITLILGLINVFFPKIHILMNIFICLSIIFQIISFIFYVRNYFLIKGKKKIL
jgi:phosphatidylglycerophosphate synthase